MRLQGASADQVQVETATNLTPVGVARYHGHGAQYRPSAGRGHMAELGRKTRTNIAQAPHLSLQLAVTRQTSNETT